MLFIASQGSFATSARLSLLRQRFERMRVVFRNNLLRRRLVAVACAGLLPATTHATSTAINISTRLHVETADNVGIAGFVVSGTGQKALQARGFLPPS